MKSKKGAEMTVGTIVIIVLALIVLVVLVVGFTGGWGNLWTRITNFFGGANVDSIVQACQMACTTEQKYEYCERDRTVVLEDKTKILGKSCYKLTCLNSEVGIGACEAVDCNLKCNVTDGWNGKWVNIDGSSDTRDEVEWDSSESKCKLKEEVDGKKVAVDKKVAVEVTEWAADREDTDENGNKIHEDEKCCVIFPK